MVVRQLASFYQSKFLMEEILNVEKSSNKKEGERENYIGRIKNEFYKVKTYHSNILDLNRTNGVVK